jgi:hypothetical protein
MISQVASGSRVSILEMLPLELLLRMRGGIHPFIPWRVCSTIGSLKNNYYKMSTYSVRVLWDKPLAAH